MGFLWDFWGFCVPKHSQTPWMMGIVGIFPAGGSRGADELQEEGPAPAGYRRLLAAAAAQPLLRRRHRVPEKGRRGPGNPQGLCPPHPRDLGGILPLKSGNLGSEFIPGVFKCDFGVGSSRGFPEGLW